jgi:hypothetical protein
MWIAASNTFDKGQTSEAALHRQIDDHDLRFEPAIDTIARRNVTRVEHFPDGGVMQYPPTRLQHDWVIVNDQNAHARWSL